MKYIKYFESTESTKKKELLVEFDDVKDCFYDLLDDGFNIEMDDLQNPYILDKDGIYQSYSYQKVGTVYRMDFIISLEEEISDKDELNWIIKNSKYEQMFYNGLKSLMSLDILKILNITSELKSYDYRMMFKFSIYQEPNLDEKDYPDQKLSQFVQSLKSYIQRVYSLKDLDIQIKGDSVIIKCGPSIKSSGNSTMIKWLDRFNGRRGYRCQNKSEKVDGLYTIIIYNIEDIQPAA